MGAHAAEERAMGEVVLTSSIESLNELSRDSDGSASLEAVSTWAGAADADAEDDSALDWNFEATGATGDSWSKSEIEGEDVDGVVRFATTEEPSGTRRLNYADMRANRWQAWRVLGMGINLISAMKTNQSTWGKWM